MTTFTQDSLAGDLARIWAISELRSTLSMAWTVSPSWIRGAGRGQHALAEPGQVGDPDAGRLLDEVTGWPIQPAFRSTSASTSRPEGSRKSPARCCSGRMPAQHLVGAPAHRRDRGDAEALVDLGAARIVDPGDHMGDVEGLAGHPGGQDVGVVAAGDGGEGVGLLDAGLLERVPVKADAGDLAAGETGAEPPESRSSWSMMATEWPASSSVCARVAPTRPQPMITKCATRVSSMLLLCCRVCCW